MGSSGEPRRQGAILFSACGRRHARGTCTAIVARPPSSRAVLAVIFSSLFPFLFLPARRAMQSGRHSTDVLIVCCSIAACALANSIQSILCCASGPPPVLCTVGPVVGPPQVQ